MVTGQPWIYVCVLAEVETVFIPFLMEETEKALDKKIVARTLLDGWLQFLTLILVVVHILYL